MSYKGRELTAGNYLKLDDIQSQFNSSTTTFNLTSGGNLFYPGSAFSILVVLGGVIQEPESAYTINQNQITFAAAPGSGDDFFCIALGVSLGIGVPGEGTVTGTKLSKPFSYDDGLLVLDSANNFIGVNSTTPTVALDVTGNVKVVGIITATSFSGDGSNLTGAGIGSTGSINTSGIITATSFSGDGSNLTGAGIGSTGSINTSGIITATSFVGDGSGLTGAGSTVSDDTTTNQSFFPIFTSITSGTVTASKVSSTKLTFNPSSGTLTTNQLNVVGVVTVGSAFIRNNAVGVGTTNTTGRNAGVSTAVGTIIFNSTTGNLQFYTGNSWDSLSSFKEIQATGGTITFSGGVVNKKIHTFTGSGTFTVDLGTGNVEYLVVAGGGGGGTDRAGGGGAGGFRTGSGFTITPGNYSITVGGGGGGSTTDSLAGSDGASSSFGPTITSTGGGGGGSEVTSVGRPGGSGGGSSYNTESFGSGTAGQGNRGGSGTGGSSVRSSGGGGGAGAVGTNGSASAIPIPGGAGLSSTISGTTTFYGGGGGAADNRDGNGISLAGAGGIGGGGAGGVGNGAAGDNGAAGNGQNGTANTGGGGGGAFNFNSSGIGGSGGSGIVIISYPA